MRKKSSDSLRLIIVLAFVAFTGSVSAQRIGPYLNAEVGAAFVQNIDSTLTELPGFEDFEAIPGTLTLDAGVRMAAAVGYTLHSSHSYEAAVQLESGVIYNSLDKIESDFGASSVDGDLWQVPVLADIIYTLSYGPRLVPYLGIGGGGVYHRLSVDSVDGGGVGRSTDSFDPAFQAMIGLRFRMDERNEIGAGYKYLAVFADETIQTHSVSFTYVYRF